MIVSTQPVLAICGHSGSGKTTLIEKLIPFLRARQVKVAVIKHSSKCVEIDRPGKDSDRYYQVGATVYLRDSCQEFYRTARGDENIEAIAGKLLENHDYVVLEGFKSAGLPKIWLLGENETVPPASVANILAVYQPRQAETDGILRFIEDYLQKRWLATSTVGCVLIGGSSSRMGTAKHLIDKGGRTWLELIGSKLSTVTDSLVIAGQGSIPDSLPWPRLIDAPTVQGPLAGILSVMRWSPWTSLVVASCDLPQITAEALSWLLAQRRPGRWAILPQLSPERLEPLLAYYDFRARFFFEHLVARGLYRLANISDLPQAAIIQPPGDLHQAWHNCNSPADLEKIQE